MTLQSQIENAQVTILLEVDNEIHLVGLDKGMLEFIEFTIKNATKAVIPTGKTQAELNKFLNYDK